MSTLKKGFFLYLLAIFVSPAIVTALPSVPSDDTASLSLKGVKPSGNSLAPNTLSIKMLKDIRQRQLRDRGLRVVVWMGEVDVEDSLDNVVGTSTCPLRVMTNDMLCDRPEFAEIRDPAVTCRDYGAYEDCSTLTGKPKRKCKIEQSRRKITWVSKGINDQKKFRIIAHASNDPFPQTLPFELSDLPTPLAGLCDSSNGEVLTGQMSKKKFRCQIGLDSNVNVSGASRVVKYTIFKKKETIGGITFQCPPLDPYFIIRK